MEFNETTTKAIGIIERERGEKHAQIRVLALQSNNGTVTKLTEYEAQKIFPPYGYIFEPGFFHKFKHQLNDIISFKVEENPRAEPGKDAYKIKTENPEVKNFGIPARKINGFKRNGLVANLDTITLEDQTDGNFYGITDKFIIGNLKIKNGKIEPAVNYRIRMWDLEQENLLITENTYRLIQEPQEESIVLDCKNDKQLFEWFRDSLKQINNKEVDYLDQNTYWREEIPNLLAKLDIDPDRLEADKIRLERIKQKFDQLELTKQDIKTLIDTSENLHLQFQITLEKHKEEYKEQYQNEIEQYQNEIEQQKNSLNNEIQELINQKKKHQTTLATLSETVKTTTQELNILKENKTRIIQDFTIIKEVLQQTHTPQTNLAAPLTNSFIIEKYINQNCPTITTKEELEEQITYQLSHHNLSTNNYARITRNILTFYNAILIENTRLGIAIIQATNNARYIIQHVEPDWLHFRQLWENGLGKIWETAHNNPETYHFLLLEDINMSAPECYARPLLDTLAGIRKHIPYAGTPFPQNLKILATIAPFNESQIGLPIHKETFQDWGTIGFRGNIREKTNPIPQPGTKYLPANFFQNLAADDHHRNVVKAAVDKEIDHILNK